MRRFIPHPQSTMGLFVHITEFIWSAMRLIEGLCLLFGIAVTWTVLSTRYQLSKKGFYIHTSLGRESEDGWAITYEEKDRSLTFSGPSEKRVVKVPSDELWNEIMPEWAKNRKNDIVKRLEQNVKGLGFLLNEYENREDAGSILASDQQIEGYNRVVQIGRATSQ